MGVLDKLLILTLTEAIDSGDDDSLEGEGSRGRNTIDRLKDDLFAEEDDPCQGASFLFMRLLSSRLIFFCPRPVDTREENNRSAKRDRRIGVGECWT